MEYKCGLKYCDKCGKLWDGGFLNEKELCAICKNLLKAVPDRYFTEEDLAEDFRGIIEPDMEQKLIEDLVKPSPNFDQWYFDHKEEIKDEQDRRYYAIEAYAESLINGTNKGNRYGVKCPYCGATNVRKIFGRSLRRFGRQWHCTHCGSDF